MSTDARASAGEEPPSVSDYDEMTAECERVIEWIDDKLETGRIRDPERARARQGYLRLKIQAIDAWRKLKETSDLSELEERLDALEGTP